MRDWNLIVTVSQWHFRRAFRLLRPIGAVSRTRFHNVLAMRVDDLGDALESVRQMIADDERAAETICRVGPAPDVFEFDSDESFTSTAQEILARYLPQLAGGTFHVRVHRRGDPLRLTSYAAERLLGDYVWESLNRMGTPAKVTFDDPDAVINVETLEDRGGMGLWPRETLEKYPFLRSN